ncbi:MAG: DDE-type integrase/transposase/recombinase [Desulfocapsaceae bacterium]|nr:DDE-type integrase/transposase/recombinase [Desulfocapsaceae bacterium]
MKSVGILEIGEALGISRRSACRKASHDNWRHTFVTGKGGLEKRFPISFLPEDIRLRLARSRATSVIVSTPAGMAGAEAGNTAAQSRAETSEKERIAAEANLAAFGEIPPARQEIAYARRDVLRAWEGFLAASAATNIKKGTARFCDLYNSGEIRIADHIKKHVDQVSWSSLCRWQAALKQDGLAGLAPDYRNPKKGTSQLTSSHKDFIIGMLKAHPNAKFSTLQMAMEARFADLPGASSIRRFTNRWKSENASLLLFTTSPDKWRNQRQFAIGDASEQVLRLNQVWEFDSTPADVMLADGRYTLIGVIDVYSRRLKLHVSKTSRSTAVAALIRRALLDWGVPETAKTDNGADYVSRHIVQVFEALQIEQILCPPFTPEAKPHIERAFKTFAHSFQELMPGYIGHSVAERKDIEARRSFASRIMGKDQMVEINMTAEELQAYCDRWCNAIYHQNKHRKLNGRTPAEVARAWQEAVRGIGNERALDILLAAAPGGGVRTVAKTGVSVDNITYISDMLPEVGTTVRVRIDTLDLGTIYIFDADTNAFLCVAQNPRRTGIDRAETAAKLRNTQKKLLKDAQKELNRIVKKQALDMVHEEILASREEKTAAIIDLPKPRKPYTTPALEEAGRAAEAMAELGRGNRQFDGMLTSVGSEILENNSRIMKREEKIVVLRSDSDIYDQIRTRIKKENRPLSRREYDWLTEYYTTNSGMMYMKLEGDLREKAGLAEANQNGM